MAALKRVVALIAAITSGLVVAELNVTVHLDATYAIDSVRGPTCSGVGDRPTGTACPLKDDVAIADCSSDLRTFNGTQCVAPVDAECIIDADTTWSCVFPDGGNKLEAEVGDLTSTLTISSDFSSEKSPWGDLPWRAPPPLDSPFKADSVERSSELQIK